MVRKMNGLISDLYIHPQLRRLAFDVAGGPCVVAAVSKLSGVRRVESSQTFVTKLSRVAYEVWCEARDVVDQFGGAS
jgi:hypothetical protein